MDPGTWLDRNAETIRGFAALPAGLAAVLDAVRSKLNETGAGKSEEVDHRIAEVLREAERACVLAQQPSLTYQCGVAVWRVGQPTRKDRSHGDERKTLRRAASRVLRYRQGSSGLDWRVGMGVMGRAVAENKTLSVNLSDVWGGIRQVTELDWPSQPPVVSQGLTFQQFQQALGAPESDAGPFIMAVPYFQGPTPLGVAVLDAPPDMGAGIRASEVVAELLWALAEYVLKE